MFDLNIKRSHFKETQRSKSKIKIHHYLKFYFQNSYAFNTSNTLKFIIFKLVVLVGPVEKWKSHFIVAVVKLRRPQAMWKKLWKTQNLWKKMSKEYLFQISTSRTFQQPVEKWKTMFNCCSQTFNSCSAKNIPVEKIHLL
jgi:hypothetical protein